MYMLFRYCFVVHMVLDVHTYSTIFMGYLLKQLRKIFTRFLPGIVALGNEIRYSSS